MKKSTRYLSAVIVLLLGVDASLAGQVGISPTRVILTPQQRVEALTLRNAGTEAVDYQITAKRWRMDGDGDGKWVLEDLPPGSDLAVFPLGFRIAPGKSQIIRVGLPKLPAAGPELAYRLFIRELPKEKQAGDKVALNVINQFSLPVFVNSGLATPSIGISPGSIRQRRWTFSVRAENGHLDPKKAKLRLLDGGGKSVHEQDVSINYVLTGATLPVTVALPAAACATAVRYEMETEAPFGKQEGNLPAGGQRTCGS